MEAFRIIRKISYYLVFFIASTLVFYFLIGLSLTRYTPTSSINSDETLIENIYLPMMYALISLIVMLVVQFLLIGKPSDAEKRLYSISLLVFFGVLLGAAVLILAEGLVSIPSNAVSTNPGFFLCALAPVFVISLSEVLYGGLGLLALRAKAKNPKADGTKTPGQ